VNPLGTSPQAVFEEGFAFETKAEALPLQQDLA
jgi:hypothetical protein